MCINMRVSGFEQPEVMALKELLGGIGKIFLSILFTEVRILVISHFICVCVNIHVRAVWYSLR